MPDNIRHRKSLAMVGTVANSNSPKDKGNQPELKIVYAYIATAGLAIPSKPD